MPPTAPPDTFLAPQMPPNPCAETIRRLFERNGLFPRRVCKKPLLTAKHRKDRVQFARRFKNYAWRKIRFCVEKIFRQRPGNNVICWRPKGKRFAWKYVEPKTQSNPGVMVWCAINSKGKVCLKKCPPRVNAWAYWSILKKAIRFLKPCCRFGSQTPPIKLYPSLSLQDKPTTVATRWLPSAQGNDGETVPPE